GPRLLRSGFQFRAGAGSDQCFYHPDPPLPLVAGDSAPQIVSLPAATRSRLLCSLLGLPGLLGGAYVWLSQHGSAQRLFFFCLLSVQPTVACWTLILRSGRRARNQPPVCRRKSPRNGRSRRCASLLFSGSQPPPEGARGGHEPELLVCSGLR